MARMLRDVGAEPLELPTVQIVPPEDAAPLVRAVSKLERYDWVVFTSANGVRFFFQALSAAGLDTRALATTQVAAIGPATRDALLSHGVRADAMPAEFRGESVAEAILARQAS